MLQPCTVVTQRGVCLYAQSLGWAVLRSLVGRRVYVLLLH